MYPEKLMKYLTSSMKEGATITQCISGDSLFCVIQFPSLDRYITVASWYEGCDDYQLVNIEGGAYTLIHTMTIPNTNQ